MWRLVILVVTLSIAVGLASTNPSMDEYLVFVETALGNALDRPEQAEPSRERQMVRSIFRARSRELVAKVIGPHTRRHNWGVLSRFETRIFDLHVEVLGIGGRFIPLQGVDESVLRLGRMVFDGNEPS